MKKVIITVFSVLLIVIIALGCRENVTDQTTTNATVENTTTTQPTTTTSVPSTTTTEQTTTTTAKPTTTTSRPTTTKTQGPTTTRHIINTDNIEWYLILANGENQLPEDHVVNTVKIKGGLTDYPFALDERIVDIWSQMYDDAKADGVTLSVISAYRSVELQAQSFNNAKEKFLKQGYSEEEAIALTAKSYMFPGCSDHNLGLAVDIGTTQTSFENTAAFKWLSENAENYGFVLRYPKDKTEITKVKYEPWHYRYVGVEAAKEMNELGMCLEEYHVYKGFVQ